MGQTAFDSSRYKLPFEHLVIDKSLHGRRGAKQSLFLNACNFLWPHIHEHILTGKRHSTQNLFAFGISDPLVFIRKIKIYVYIF